MSSYIYQANKADCGFASLKMMLVYLSQDKNYQYLTKDCDKRSNYSFKDLKRIAKKQGLILDAFRYERKFDVVNTKTPFLASLSSRDNAKHLVFVKSIKKGKVVVLDPDKGKYKMSFQQFVDTWDGHTLEINTYQKQKCEKPKPVFPSFFLIIISFALELLGIASLIIGLNFVIDEQNILVPIALLSAFAICELISRLLKIESLKRFDKYYLHRFDENIEPIETNYRFYCDYKKTIFTLMQTMFSLATTTTLIIFILLSNNLLNLAPIGIFIILAIIDRFVFVRRDKKKLDAIAKQEQFLFKRECGHSEIINDINALSYRYAFSFSAREIVYSFLALIASFVMMLFANLTSVNFLLFYFFVFRYLANGLSNVLRLDIDYHSYLRKKYRFYDLFIDC